MNVTMASYRFAGFTEGYVALVLLDARIIEGFT